MDTIADYARARIEAGSKSFAAAARLFDPETRDSVSLLYAWCRYCDDEIDGQELGFATGRAQRPVDERLAALKDGTRAALAGVPAGPPFEALARVAARHGLPAELAFEHLEGFAMDARGATYATCDDTLTYCWHVAGAVGVMMAIVMGASGQDTLARASDLGIAFQLTNIARDVIDDAAEGRVYLPSDWLAGKGIPLMPHALAAPGHRAVLHEVVTRLLDLAEDYYAASLHGIARLPPRSALAIAAARAIYREIGLLLRKRGARAWDRRAVVGDGGKLLALGKGVGLVAATRLRASLAAAPSRQGLWTPPMLRASPATFRDGPAAGATMAGTDRRDARGDSRNDSR